MVHVPTPNYYCKLKFSSLGKKILKVAIEEEHGNTLIFTPVNIPSSFFFFYLVRLDPPSMFGK